MRRGVWSNKCEYGRQHAHKNGQPNATPTTPIMKLPKNLLGCTSRRHDPKRDKNGKEAADVKHQHSAFNERQSFGKISVEDNSKEADQ